MQNIDLICVGKLNAKYFAECVAEYQKRLAAFASFRIIELPEEKIEEKNASDAVVKKALEKEGKAILSNVRKGAAIVALCIEGKQSSSEELARFLADRAGREAGEVAIVLGSSHVLADEVKRAAALKFSMGRITMPHQLARLVLTAPLYRACTINAGMIYHKYRPAAPGPHIRGRKALTERAKHGSIKIYGSWESCRNTTHDTASQPRTERMLLQWNRAKRPLI